MSIVPRILAWTRPPLQLAVMGLAAVGYLRNSVVIALAATALSAANRSQWPKTRWWLLVLILTVISLGASAACCTQACIRQREAAYRSILASYSEVLKVGMTRKEVEAYLERNGKPFRRTCRVAEWLGKNAWDDIVKIGKESAPFGCSEHNVYVGFEFFSAEVHRLGLLEAHDSDTLKSISIVHRLEGCF